METKGVITPKSPEGDFEILQKFISLLLGLQKPKVA
jgi:hypothetical protein